MIISLPNTSLNDLNLFSISGKFNQFIKVQLVQLNQYLTYHKLGPFSIFTHFNKDFPNIYKIHK